MCKNINFVIDCVDYANKYLNFKELKKIVQDKPLSRKMSGIVQVNSKGTTPRSQSGRDSSIGSDQNISTPLPANTATQANTAFSSHS